MELPDRSRSITVLLTESPVRQLETVSTLKVSLKRATIPVDGSSGAIGPAVGTGTVW